MAEVTAISWCDHTWSPWYGCTQVSMGEKGACVGCYARHLSETRMGRVVFGGPGRGEGTRDARADSAWSEPPRWNRTTPGTFVFPSMCDPFDNHPDLPPLRRRFMDLIRATPDLYWLLLTKRPGNIIKLFADTLPPTADKRDAALREAWPRNAAIGCTVVTQVEADRDIPKLLQAKAALNPAFAFVSMEPLLGPVDLTCIQAPRYVPEDHELDWKFDALAPGSTYAFQDGMGVWESGDGPEYQAVDWVITGGETDQGAHRARPSHPQWFRDIRDQCAAAGVPYHHKQNGVWAPGECSVSPQTRRQETADWFPEGWLFSSISQAEAEDLTCDDEPTVWRLGKADAGRWLDGETHDARPGVRP